MIFNLISKNCKVFCVCYLNKRGKNIRIFVNKILSRSTVYDNLDDSGIKTNILRIKTNTGFPIVFYQSMYVYFPVGINF